MSVFRKENWLLYLILSICSFGAFTFVVASYLDLYDKDEWYYKWHYWVAGFICGIIPCIIMLVVLNIQLAIKIALKLDVPYSNIYSYPYLWMVSLIIPIIGWATFMVLCMHVYLYPAIQIKNGFYETIN